jgi:hypothetical protein
MSYGSDAGFQSMLMKLIGIGIISKYTERGIIRQLPIINLGRILDLSQ